MRHSAAAAPVSSLPSVMMPCPICADRMVYQGRHTVGSEFEDTIYACRNCGAEVIRTSVCHPGKSEADKPAAAAA
jgi:DNA-directed RNA polymerase subunit RPC12/RpoP